MQKTERDSCLVIMPFGRTAEDRLRYNLTYDHVILPAINDAGWAANRVDRENVGGTLHEHIEERLRTAPLVVADISGNNPNVMFELGARRVHGRPFICVSCSPDNVAFSARQFQIHDYSEADARVKISSAIKKAVAGTPTGAEEEQLSELNRVVRAAHGSINSFQERVSGWRIRRARKEAAAIHQGKWSVDINSPAMHAAYIFQRLIEQLREGEEFWTITNLGFWSEKSVGESELLQANRDAAVKGVTIKRVFLIDRDKWSQVQSRRAIAPILRKHLSIQQEVERQNPGKMQVRCLLPENYQSATERFSHFALVRSDAFSDTEGVGLVVIPEHNPVGQISHIRLEFPGAQDDVQRYVARFEEAFQRADDLAAVLAPSTKPPRAA